MICKTFIVPLKRPMLTKVSCASGLSNVIYITLLSPNKILLATCTNYGSALKKNYVDHIHVCGLKRSRISNKRIQHSTYITVITSNRACFNLSSCNLVNRMETSLRHDRRLFEESLSRYVTFDVLDGDPLPSVLALKNS